VEFRHCPRNGKPAQSFSTPLGHGPGKAKDRSAPGGSLASPETGPGTSHGAQRRGPRHVAEGSAARASRFRARLLSQANSAACSTRVCATECPSEFAKPTVPARACGARRGLSLPAAADEAPRDLGPVIVTADRAPVPASETLASVTVLTREDIERSQAPDLLTLLARQAGIDVARTGGQGQASTVFLRGGNSTHALVLIDGVRVNPATQGAPDFAHLPLAQIERIEIVRGPRAALWGSDAIGGVIQVFTRDPAKAFAGRPMPAATAASAPAPPTATRRATARSG
jgi:hypothetical protein